MALTVTLFVLALFMRPIEGDLTRLGGYLSNDFSINDDHKYFKKPLYKLAKNKSDYDRYYDVVVIGDSFSRDLKIGWQNFLSNSTGVSIITFDIQKISPDQILDISMFKNKPPKMFIYESVEYAVWLRNSQCSKSVFNENRVLKKSPVIVSLLGVEMETKVPSVPGYESGNLDFDAAANYLYKSLFRNLLGLNVTEVRKYEVTDSNLFSNSDDKSILFHYKDFDKSKIQDKEINITVCSLLQTQDKVQSNGKTEYLFFPVPDKLSAYSGRLKDKSFKDISIIEELDTRGLNIVRVDKYVSKSIADNVTDLYLPDNTHWSYKGYSLAALAICEYFMDKGIFLSGDSLPKASYCKTNIDNIVGSSEKL